MQRPTIFGTVLAFAVAFAAAAGAVELKGAGATFPAPLYYAWINEFQKAHTDVVIDYNSVGSGEGIKRFIAGTVDFGASDAAMTDAEIARVDRGVVMVPATAGMIVVAYNILNFAGDLRLSRGALAGIFAGEITEWNDPRIAADNPGVTFPRRTISVIARRESSGTTFAFTNHLSAVSGSWADDGPGIGRQVRWPGRTMMANGNEGVSGRIRISEYSIGYIEYGFAARLGLPMASLQNRDGQFVAPTADTGAAALDAVVGEMPPEGRQLVVDPAGVHSYPITSYSWLLLYGRYDDEQKVKALKDFLGWGLEQGQATAAEIGYIPLPGSVKARAQSLLASVD